MRPSHCSPLLAYPASAHPTPSAGRNIGRRGARENAGTPPTARVVFLDFDGVLHPVSALEVFQRRLPREDAIHTGGLFRWTYVLSELLEGDEDIGVVVHSSWRRLVREFDLRRYLGPLGGRLLGATPGDYARWPSIQYTVEALKPTAWLVLDDHVTAFPQPLPTEVVICDPEEGVWSSSIRSRISQWLTATRPNHS